MRKIQRPAQGPTVITENIAKWTSSWVTKVEESIREEKKAQWRWPQKDGKPLNQLIWPDLSGMTDHHCAYCDGPFSQSRETIDHFRPKVRFPKSAFEWTNLFPACDLCQSRLDDWDERLLKPDAEDFRFCDYFLCDAATGKIVPNPQASAEDRERAETTITIFKLNNPARSKQRKRELDSFYNAQAAGKDCALNDFNYRFFIETFLN
ncbi:MAG: TIGR02646 family protein [Proteobacteria bacterium]|nr:TIGR02646 family protein [Pseudomonadota bacterium]